MTESALDPVPVTPEPAGVDLSAYRTAELAERINGLLGLAERLLTLVGSALFVVVVGGGVAYLLLSGRALWIHALGTGYGLLAGGLVGIAAGVLWLVRIELTRVEELLDLLLATTARVSADLARARSDPKNRPGPGELLPEVHRVVFFPLLKGVLRKQLWLLGIPVSWVLGFVLGRAVGGLGKALTHAGVGWGEVTELTETEVPSLEHAEAEVTESRDRLSTVRSYLRGVGRVMRALLVPAWIALGLGVVLAGVPLIVVLYLTA